MFRVTKVGEEALNRRGRLEIMHNIISLCLRPVQENYIKYQADLSLDQLHKYINFLVQTKFLEIRKTGQGDLYKATEKGMNFIGEYKNFIKLLK